MAEHQESRERKAQRDEDAERTPEEGREERPRSSRHDRSLGDTATSHGSAGGTQAGRRREAAPGVVPRRSRFRPVSGDDVEVDEIEEDEGFRLPYTGESASTRGSTFQENPNTGETAEEEEGEFLRESLERRTRGYEGG